MQKTYEIKSRKEKVRVNNCEEGTGANNTM